MRFYERQEGETPKAWEAFKVYRDLGSTRSLAKCAELYYGARKNLAQLAKWSAKNAWVERVQAYEDYKEMERREAIERYDRTRYQSEAEKDGEIQNRLRGVKEKLLGRLETMAEWPLEKRSIERGENGEEITNIYPARWSFHTVVKAIEVLDDSPDKLALTDPTGSKEYGQDTADVEDRFLELLERHSGSTHKEE